MAVLLRSLNLLRRRLLIHRRGLAALCVALAVWLTIGALRPPPPPSVSLWTASRDLASGTVLSADDFRRTDFAPGSVPASAARDLRALLGRTLATPLSEGEVATRSRLMTTDRLAAYPGRAAIALRIPDPEVVGLLRAGDRVDLVASDPQQDQEPERLVRDAVVLAVPRPLSGAAASSTTGLAGRLVVFAVPAADVARLAAAGTALFLTVVWNR